MKTLLFFIIFFTTLNSNAGPLRGGYSYTVKLCPKGCMSFGMTVQLDFLRLNNVFLRQNRSFYRYRQTFTFIRLDGDVDPQVRICGNRGGALGGVDQWTPYWRQVRITPTGGAQGSTSSVFNASVVDCTLNGGVARNERRQAIRDAIAEIRAGDLDDAAEIVQELKNSIRELVEGRGEPYPGNADLHAACEALEAALEALEGNQRRRARGHLNTARRKINDARKSKGAASGVPVP